MQAYTAYCENGRIILVGNPKIPEGRKLIITVLDETIQDDITLASEQSLAKDWLLLQEDKAWANL